MLARRLAAFALPALSLLAIAPAASAHAGDHGASALAAIAHLVSDPYHLLIAFGAAALIGLARLALRGRAAARIRH